MLGPNLSGQCAATSLPNRNLGLLERLLHPISPREFVSEYWGAKALHVRGHREKYAEIFGCAWDKQAFAAAVREGTAREAKVRADNLSKQYNVDLLRAEFDHSGYLASAKGVRPFAAIRADQFEPMLAAGATMRLYGVMTIDPTIGAVAEALKAELHYPGDVVVNSVLSPRSRGVSSHFDAEGLLIFQTAGRKRYFYSERPAVQWPRGKGFVFSDGRIRYTGTQTILKGIGEQDWEKVDGYDESKLIEVTLEPGDLLYWPPGTVHKTTADETEESVSLMLVFLGVNFQTLLDFALGRILTANPAWRHLPVWVGDDHGQVPPAVASFFGERLDEVRTILNSLSPTGLEINRMWHEMVRSPEPPRDAADAPDAHRPVERTDRLRLSADKQVSYAVGPDRRGNRAMHVYWADKELEISEEWVPFFEALLKQSEFIAESALQWGSAGKLFAWEAVKEHLSVLCAEGFLQRMEGEVGR